MLYILSPFLNKIIKSFSQKTFKNLLIIFVIYFFILKTLIYGNAIEPFESVLGFIFFYFVGAYIKLYEIKFFDKLKQKNLFLAIGIIFLIVGLNIYNIKLLPDINMSIIKHIKAYISLISNYQISSIFILICCICIFYFFKNLNIKNNKFINFIASTTFGCYLIHDNTLVRPTLWKNLFDMQIVLTDNIKSLLSSNTFIFNKILALPMVFISNLINIPTHYLLPIHCILVVIFILFICAIIEFIRINFIEKHLVNLINKNKTINKIFNKLDNWINE